METLTLNERETQFFEEVYNLMKNKYPGLEEKFGIWRVHQHFDLQGDELFHETSSVETKESVLRIIKKNNLPENAFPSSWKLTESGPVVATWCCDDNPML